MPFIPDTDVLDKPTKSFVPDSPSFTPDKPTSSFIPDKPNVADITISAGKNLLKGAASFFIQTPQIAGSLIKEQGEMYGEKPDYTRLVKPEPLDLMFGPTMKIADVVVKEAKSRLAERTSVDEDITKIGQNLIDANKRFFLKHKIEPDKGTVNRVMFDIGSAGSSVLTSIGLAYLTKSPGAIAPLFGLIQKGQVYEEARKKGKTPKEASIISTAAGIPEAALEYVGLNIFINKLRGLKSLPRIALRAGEQALQEGSQQFSEETIAKVSNLRNTTWPDIIKKSAYSAAIGLITGLPAATVATYGENKGILGDFRKAGFTDDEAMPIIEKLIEKQQENIKPEVINTLNEEVKKTDDFVLKPEDQMTIRQELEKYIQIPKDIKTYEIKAGVGEAIPEAGKAEKAPVIAPEAAKTPIVEAPMKGEMAGKEALTGKVIQEARNYKTKEDYFASMKGVAVEYENKIYSSPEGTHIDLIEQNNIPIDKIQSEGFIDAKGNYLKQHPESIWEQSQLSPTEGKGEVKRVADNILKNNPDITRTDAEAMAKDVIENRKIEAKIPATKSGQEYLAKPDNPLKTDFLNWAKLRLGDDYSGFKLSTYTDGEPYFKHPIGTEVSLRDYIQARDMMTKLSGKKKLTDKEQGIYQANIKYFPELKQPPQPKAPTGREGFILKDMLNPARWDSVRQFIEDDWLRVKRLIQQKGANVTETNNPYEAEIRYWGRIGARTEEADRLISDIDKDIVTTSKKLNISNKLFNKEIDRFLIARHAPERNAIHGEKAAGITDKEAFTIRAEIAGKPYAKEVERVADRIQELNNKTLDTLLEGEVITKELYDSLRTLYKNHIPLHRVMSDEDDIVEVLTRRGFDVQGVGLKRAKGSELEVADILTNVVTNYKSALARAEKNIVDNYTLRFARENEYFDGLFEEIKAKAIGKTFDGRIILEQIRDPKVLPVREKGNQVYLKINDAQLAMALRGVNRQKVDGLLRGVKAFTRFYSGLMTRFNPEFVVSNKIRDLQEVAVYLASKNEIGFKGTVEAIIKDPQSIKDITDAIRGKDTEGTRLYKQMKMDGGTTGGMGLSTREQLEINLNRIRSINRSSPRKVAEIVLRSIDAWNTIFEDSSRLSVYRQALKQGVSRNKAAVLAKEASVNFNKMGTGSPVINALYMFSNASVQGTAKMLRAMRNPKVLATVLTLLGGAAYLVNEYNDKKDKDWRKKVSKWDRLNGLNIVISTDKGIKYVTIPISWGLKPIKVFFDELGDLASGHETSVSQALSGLVASTVEAYNPAGGTDIVSSITPSILDLPVDIARNRSWTGGKIRPDWNNSAPASIQYFDSLREKLSGQKFIEVTKELGEKGFEISPADLNYAFEQLIGGTGRAVTKTLNTIVGVTQGKPQAKEIPFVSRFYRDIPEEQIREFGKDYNDLKKTLQQQDKNRFYLGQEAELAWDGLKQIPIEKRKEYYLNIQKTNPWLADKIKDVAKDEQLNLNYNDRLIKKLGVENGERSKYLWEKISKLKTSEERKTFYLEMRTKNVITDEVARQIKIRARKK